MTLRHHWPVERLACVLGRDHDGPCSGVKPDRREAIAVDKVRLEFEHRLGAPADWARERPERRAALQAAWDALVALEAASEGGPLSGARKGMGESRAGTMPGSGIPLPHPPAPPTSPSSSATRGAPSTPRFRRR